MGSYKGNIENILLNLNISRVCCRNYLNTTSGDNIGNEVTLATLVESRTVTGQACYLS